MESEAKGVENEATMSTSKSRFVLVSGTDNGTRCIRYVSSFQYLILKRPVAAEVIFGREVGKKTADLTPK